MKKQIPNILSIARIPLSVSLVFLTQRPFWFILIYSLSGLTDLFDGLLARRYHWESAIGAKLDTIADTTLILAILTGIFITPWVRPAISPRIIVLIGAIILVKIINLVFIKLKFKEWNSVHTFFNKCIGLPFFLAVPICMAFQRVPQGLLEIVCILMIVTFLEEFFIVLLMKEFEVNTKSVFTVNNKKMNPAAEAAMPAELREHLLQSGMAVKKGKSLLYKMDIASFVYPVLANRHFNDTYRIRFTMQSAIRPDKLSQAVLNLASRFPTLYTQLHRGFFWYYTKPAYNFDVVEKDDGQPCRPFPIFKSDRPMFRVLYDDKNRISFEIFHGVTDGICALGYFKTLIAHYLELCGREIAESREIYDIHEKPDLEELEDAYCKNRSNDKPASRKEPDAYQYRPGFQDNQMAVISGSCKIADLKAAARRYDCGMTEFMLCLCGYLLLEHKRANRASELPVIVNSAANLRNVFPSKTLHNFVMLANLNVELNGASPRSLEETIAVMKPQFATEWGREKLQALINLNVNLAKSGIANIAPLFIKRPVTKIGAVLCGERKHTANITNLGYVKLPPGMGEEVLDMSVHMGATVTNGLNGVAIGYKDSLRMTFNCSPDAAAVPLAYFEALRGMGVEAEVMIS
ncbi:MAG: CDP-alcohol phosphatidyltransferase family protein [Oscillospiraceae bacterium]|nr:CDP-alcohol phosphatidyltransferase family protein [Oscillospiraceae bacterium]